MIDRVLERANLKAAWLDVQANKGAPGVDEVTLTRWGRNWEANLERLRAQARGNTYRPNRPRRFKVLKKDGTYRELSILKVRPPASSTSIRRSSTDRGLGIADRGSKI